ncbi:hypothetical protein [Rhodoferax sp.]|uniref:hypothetical protein n=1 Tax=Rhodoferax sp. TaxID=50421 RepID=UPI00276E3F53|nr:hypothetical protein [Rhodoferax sp.]
MSQAIHPIHRAAPSQAVARSLVWLVRWLLVLLLMAEQIGSPLHRHHHNFGVDGSALHGQHLGASHLAHHVEGGQHEPSLFHAVTTLRVESRLSATPDAPGDAGPQPLVLPLAWAMPWPDPEASKRVSWAKPAAPPRPLHRSLPPAGRGPPARA